MMRRVILVLIASLALAGCGQKKAEAPKDSAAKASVNATESAQKLIKRYNQLLSEGYKTLNMNPLQEVATPELAQKAYYHMAALGEGTTRMYSDLKKIEFLTTDLSKPHSCTVTTKETWDFSYVDIKTGTKSSEIKDYVYYVSYLITEKDNRWLLSEINATGEDRKEMPSWKTMIEEKRKKAQ